MVKGLVTNQSLTDIADAIRNKRGVSTQYKPSQMASVVMELPTYRLGKYISNKTDFSHFFAGNSLSTVAPTVDTSKGTNFSYFFNDCTVLGQYQSDPQVPLYDTSKGTNFSYMFCNCKQLKTVPLYNTSKGTSFSNMFNGCIRLTSAPAIDTSLGTSFSSMFNGCTALVNIPQIDMSSVTSASTHQNIVKDCPNLSNESLNNILAALDSRPTPSSATYRKLSYAGISETQAQVCTTLSNWASLEAKGWVTGY